MEARHEGQTLSLDKVGRAELRTIVLARLGDDAHHEIEDGAYHYEYSNSPPSHPDMEGCVNVSMCV